MQNTSILARQDSKDGSRKYLIEYDDGVRVEAVAMPYQHGREFTLCASSQAGCGMDCAFCATGKGGLKRSLTAQEMLKQVNLVINDMREDDRLQTAANQADYPAPASTRAQGGGSEPIRLGNLVLMGQGEPFNNYDNVLEFIQILNHRKRNKLGARKIAVSTAGVVKGIRRFAEVKEQFRLAVSLHSAIQTTRDQIMPGLARQPLRELQKAMEHYIDARGRRITLEITLLDGVNDSNAEAYAMAEFCYGEKYYVNLIPYNDFPGSRFHASSRMEAYRQTLRHNGVNAELRKSRGQDIQGACGQLVASA
jgi:23S rRNA (adenine2503-C2)-methyltransferase